MVSILLTLNYLIYGILEDIYFIYIPNGLGFVIYIIALFVYLYIKRYMRKFEENNLLKKLNMESPNFDFGFWILIKKYILNKGKNKLSDKIKNRIYKFYWI